MNDFNMTTKHYTKKFELYRSSPLNDLAHLSILKIKSGPCVQKFACCRLRWCIFHQTVSAPKCYLAIGEEVNIVIRPRHFLTGKLKYTFSVSCSFTSEESIPHCQGVDWLQLASFMGTTSQEVIQVEIGFM